jgi:hypothetical protein
MKMHSKGRRPNGSTEKKSTALHGTLARDGDRVPVVGLGPSNGGGLVSPRAVSMSAQLSVDGSRVPGTISAGLADQIAASTAAPEGVFDGVVAREALERALRHVPATAMLVVGSRSDVVAGWLRQRGYDAEPLELPTDANGEQGTRAQSLKPDVILAADLGAARAGCGALFGAIKRMLAPDGLLIAVVPNLTHARTRIAMLLGRYSARSNGSDPSFTIQDIERLLHDAAFTVVDVERQVDGPDALKEMSNGVPEPVLTMLANDLDAMTSHFVVLAEAQSSSSVVRCHRRLTEITDAHRVMVRDVERLEGRVAALDVRVRHWATETDRLALNDVSPPAAGRDGQIANEVHALAERLAAERGSEAERDNALNRARESLLKRIDDVKTLVARIERTRYRREVLRIRQVVSREVPRGSIVAVISRGDEDLLAFDNRLGWHFPRTEKGIYAGHHPADSKAAIAHVRELRAHGARYLVIPRTAFWWLAHYREFNEYLERRCRCAWRDERTCVVFALSGDGAGR